MESIIMLVIYFIPAFIALIKDHEMKGTIFLLNAILGWTIFGWFIALYVVFRKPDSKEEKQTEQEKFDIAPNENNLDFTTHKSKIKMPNNSIITKTNTVSLQSKQTSESQDQQELKCPRCNSNQVFSYQKGYGWGKGLVGGVALGPLGLLAGGIGSKDIKLTCFSCKYEWYFKEHEKKKKEFNKTTKQLAGETLLYLILVIIGILFIYAISTL